VSDAIEQAKFTGWAVVEMMGHRKEIGYVTTEAYGSAVLFRVDTPELPEREITLTSPEYVETAPGLRSWCPAGTKAKRAAVQARSCLVAPSSLYAMNPCTEQAARAAIERSFVRPLILVEMPAGMAALSAPEPADDFDDDDSLGSRAEELEGR
jgi:hypothetical protein